MADEIQQFIELPNVNIKADKFDSGWTDKPDEDFSKDPFDAANNYLHFGATIDTDSFAGNETPEVIRNLAMVYGNNVFALTVDYNLADKTANRLVGVLKEMPKLTFGATWEENHAGAVANAIKKLQDNPTYQTITSIVGAPQTPVILAGPSTSRRYKEPSSHASFDLSFRIYSMESIGPSTLMTGYKRALAMLTLYAAPLHTMDMSNAFNYLAYNLGNTLSKALTMGADLTDYLAQATDPDSDAEPESNETTKRFSEAATQTSNLFNATKTVFGSLNADPATRAANVQAWTNQIKVTADAIATASAPVNTVLHKDIGRVSHEMNVKQGKFGGALWNLTLYPGLFNYSIPVYVENWSVKQSKQIDSFGNPAYCDFTVTCVMDQQKSANWWLKQIMSDDYDEYKTDFARNAAKTK